MGYVRCERRVDRCGYVMRSSCVGSSASICFIRRNVISLGSAYNKVSNELEEQQCKPDKLFLYCCGGCDRH